MGTNLPNNLKEAQLGGNCKCGSCGCLSSLMQDLDYALQCKRRTLASLQQFVLAGKFGNAPESLKPLDGLRFACRITSSGDAYFRKA